MAVAARRRGGPARSRRVHQQHRSAGRRDRHGRSPGRVLLRDAGRPPAPVIIAAPAYRDGGLIVITFDEGSGTTACCGENSGLGPSHPTAQPWTPTAWPAIPKPGE